MLHTGCIGWKSRWLHGHGAAAAPAAAAAGLGRRSPQAPHRRPLPPLAGGCPRCALPVRAAAPSFDSPVGKREKRRPPSGGAGGGGGGSGGGGGTGATRPSQEQRLAKVLAAAGVASRRKCEELIEQGRVAVNGAVVSVQGFRVVPSKDRVSVDGRDVRLVAAAPSPPPGARGAAKARAAVGAAAAAAAAGCGPHAPVYFALHKPAGYICSNVSSKPGRRAVDLLEPWLQGWQQRQRDKSLLPPRLLTVGRLDVGTSGLCLVTNDGAWANRVIHPSSGLTKEYLATVSSAPTRQQLEALRQGATVEGVLCVPKLVEVAGLSGGGGDEEEEVEAAWGSSGSGGGSGGAGDDARTRGVSGAARREGRVLRIVVGEGKKHEVRVLVAAAGLELVKLHRTRVGGYRLPRNMPPGAYAELPRRQAEALLRDSYAAEA